MSLIFVLLLFLGLITPFSISTLVLNWLCFGVLIIGIIVSKKIIKKEKWLVRIALGLMFMQIVNFAIIDGKDLRKQIKIEPQPEFMTDMSSYLSTYYRVKKGEEFYKAFETDIRGRLGGNMPGEIWGWKQPLIFYIWNLIPPDGESVMTLAVLMICADLFFIYKIGRKFLSPVKALVSPFIVLPYFHYVFVDMTLFQIEWWALSFFILALYFYLYKKKWEAGIFFVLTLMVRELFAIPIVFVVLAEILKKNWKGVFKLIIPTLVFFFPYYYFVHFRNILRFESLETLLSNSGRTQYKSGWSLVRTTLAYGSWNYAIFKLRPFLVLLGLNSLVLGWKIFFNKKDRWNWFLLLGLFLPFFLASFKIGIIDIWHDYWGIYYVPLMLIVTPIVLGFKK